MRKSISVFPPAVADGPCRRACGRGVHDLARAADHRGRCRRDSLRRCHRSGLVDGAAPSLAVYDLFVSYDSSLLSVVNVTFGTGLDIAGFGSDQVTGDPPGLLEVVEYSFDSIADLNTLQPDAFTLFTVTFSADAVGTSLLGLALNGPQSSAEGTALTVDALNGASVSAVTPVPLPAAAWLLLSGLARRWLFSRKGDAPPEARSRADDERGPS